ncbi:hypothetical protein GCM10010353_37960 [Streptomyces chryseus]|nr:hypothetical protein GCM10010353_37960 [Streptomyces chryseus]
MFSTCPPGGAASVAATWLPASRTAATTTAPPAAEAGELSASRVFTTRESPSSPLGGRISTAFAVHGLTLARSAGSVVRPFRQMIRVEPVRGRWVEISSSISTLSLGARTAMAAPRWLALAATSSVTTGKIWSPHPSTTVCPSSMTVECPSRSAMIRWLIPVVIRLTSVDTNSRATSASDTDAST